MDNFNLPYPLLCPIPPYEVVLPWHPGDILFSDAFKNDCDKIHQPKRAHKFFRKGKVRRYKMDHSLSSAMSPRDNHDLFSPRLQRVTIFT